ncbi:TPA: DNA adenine methylase [Salmonella enterica subsp. enterica serovar Wandsworth]
MNNLLMENIPARQRMPSQPFLKWVGSKRRSIATLLKRLPSPDEVECLVEPFVGGASVFLGTDYRQYLLADMFEGMSCAVYCDPPYLPVSQTSGFTAYSGEVFTVADHERLAVQLAELHARKNMPVVISASDTPFSHRIYGQAGFRLYGHRVSRMVSASAASRKSADELTGVLKRGQ